ncbi:MAG: ABC transporter substrate-binding protein [Nitrospirae bacterium]|nr:ABC transporter substrate-binding protein [Nitrospirota bacterium]
MKGRSFPETIFAACLIVLLMAAYGYAGEPTDIARQTTDRVIDILKNKELRRAEKTKERRAAIRKVVSEHFDFEEMAKRSLAQYWRQRTPEERKEFVVLYADLLERTYIRKVESYSDEKITYGEESSDSVYAIVKTKIVTKRNVDIPVEYRMEKKSGNWVVYDVIIEGVSLVNNYRNQFNKIIVSGSYEELVKRLKKKQVEGSDKT